MAMATWDGMVGISYLGETAPEMGHHPPKVEEGTPPHAGIWTGGGPMAPNHSRGLKTPQLWDHSPINLLPSGLTDALLSRCVIQQRVKLPVSAYEPSGSQQMNWRYKTESK